ncbi:MAG: UTP--glucose-1-phosphate uridylyltransferase GalU [Holosporales bacterium]
MVRKAIFPVGGLGTRFLPATKSMPKEMLPIVDKPLIQYAVEEALAAGVEQIIFVTGRGKQAIENHFDHATELLYSLERAGKSKVIEASEDLVLSPGSIVYTRQQEPLGLGHAVWCARHLIDGEPFAVLLADDFIVAKQPCLKQMMDVHRQHHGVVVAVQEVHPSHVNRYGIISPLQKEGDVVEFKDVVEKPKPAEAPSNMAVIGRYILPAEIMGHLEAQERGAGGEIQLTDAIKKCLTHHKGYGLQFEGERFDCGDKAGFVAATLKVALQRSDLGASVRQALQEHQVRIDKD